jgi:hypothetical protein
MDDLLVRLLRHRQAVAHVTTLPSTLLLASFVLTVPLVAQTIARRRLAAVMAIFRQSPFQVSHPSLQLADPFSQGCIFRSIPQQSADLLAQLRIFCFQLG